MTDHFSIIGFQASSAEELATLIGGLPEDHAESLECRPGYYYRWHTDAGSELWIHMQKRRDEAAAEGDGPPEDTLAIVGVTPFFAGAGRVPIRAVAIKRRPEDNAFEGAIFAEVEPGEDLHDCTTVALFDVVDFACLANRVAPFKADAQVTAFAHDIAAFDDAAAFEAAQDGQEVRFAPKSFFASGLFMPPEGGDADQPVFHDPDEPGFNAPSRAFLSGEVIRSEIRTNPVTGQSFCWALVETLGGTVDVVALEAQIEGREGALAPGMIVQGEFWLCGRLLSDG
jgi:hypothetical protein